MCLFVLKKSVESLSTNARVNFKSSHHLKSFAIIEYGYTYSSLHTYTLLYRHPSSRDRRDQKFRFDTDTDTFSGSRSILRLILILKVGLNRDRYWYWYQENVPGLILIPRLYLIRILPKPYKKCTSLWIDTGTDTETQNMPRTRSILIPKGLVWAFSIRYGYSHLSLLWWLAHVIHDQFATQTQEYQGCNFSQRGSQWRKVS